MTDKNETKKENVENKSDVKEIKIPKHRLSEHKLEMGSIVDLFDLDLEELIYEKMYILFEKFEFYSRELKVNKDDLQSAKEKMLLTTDFEKELGKSRPTIADKDAYMRPKLAEFEEKIAKTEMNEKFYKNKLTIVNDLIKFRTLQLKIESTLDE